MKTLEPSWHATRRQYGLFTDFCEGLAPKQQHTYRVADLDAGVDLALSVIWAPSEPVLVTDISVLPDGSAGGIDNSNTSVWTVNNGATAMVATTYQADNAFPADNVQESLGTIAANYLAAGGRMEISVTNGTTANTVPTEVTIEYRPTIGIVPGFTFLPTDHGSVTISDGVLGVIDINPSDGSEGDNDEAYLFSTTELFKFADDKGLVAECRLKWTEANTDDANILFGLMDAWAADHLQDDGAGPPSSYDGAVIYKVDGATVWTVETSNATTQTTTTTDRTSTQTTFQTLRIVAKMISSADCEVTFWCDSAGGVNFTQLRDTSGNPIKHTIAVSGLAEMAVGVGVKNGVGSDAETLSVDYIGCEQLR
jgi:hypothetical protein